MTSRGSSGSRLKSFLLAGIIVSMAAAPAAAQQSQTVAIARGKTQTTMLGAIKGKAYRDYLIAAGAGQMLSVRLTGNGSTYFNVLPPGSNDVAIFNGSMDGNSFERRLERSGRYTVRVYQMGAAEDSGRNSIFTLKVGVTGGSGAANGNAGGKVNIADLSGMNSIRAIDVMAERGFRDVDSFSSGNTQYGIFWRPTSRQCVQLTMAAGRVAAANDIGTHPKCR
ncbi:hypothetical protein GCM10022280_09000 [Sphingomonas swuensis]|uniref:Peptidase C-terminal archaeal/bacterial domain-containing protein n=1 Tax=Sphingomonas swuensis TaxID=977800 RepID=A0ABP7SKQ7_9SPHN